MIRNNTQLNKLNKSDIKSVLRNNTQLNKLSKSDIKAVLILSTGTFLEYFDLMLFVHMGILMGELFFPKSDPLIASYVSAFLFCSTYIFRPFGALIFGYIGDNISRTKTVIISTIMMSTSCLFMANIPTYAQIGITASILVSMCRIFQGMSSMGEIIGSELYLSELIPHPYKYSMVAIICCCASLGGSSALGIAYLVNTIDMNWRVVFWIGSLIAIVSFFARTKLNEPQEFLNAQKSQNKNLVDIKESTTENKVNRKTAFSYLLIECAWPVWFYLTYIYSANILKNKFAYATESIIQHNFAVSILYLCIELIMAYLVLKIHPLKLNKIRAYSFVIIILLLPILLTNASNAKHIFFIQILILSLGPTGYPAAPVFFRQFPIFKRATYSTLTYSISRAVMHLITPFSIIILTEQLGYFGLWVIMIPVIIGYLYGFKHFEYLENKSSNNLAQ